MTEVEVAIVGGGIAGASAAAHLAPHHKVVLLEREDQPGYHASGRSAALFTETYGNAVVRGLTVASRPFLASPPPGFAEHPLLTPRGVLHVGGEDDLDRLSALHAETSALVPDVRFLGGAEARRLVPALKEGWVRGGVLEPDARDIDTHGCLQGFLRVARAYGAEILTRAEVVGIERRGGRWRLRLPAAEVSADILVNAAGAWADRVAALAGVPRRGLQPMRRTAFLFGPPDGVSARDWPMVVGPGEAFYFKPDAGLLLASPADEAPSEPTDAQPEEIDVAVAADRIQEIAELPIRRILRRWAGLRTFAPDRTPVVGFDPAAESFFWLAGQGGYGFHTAPALAAIAAGLITRNAVPEPVADLGIAADHLAPGRLPPR
ncbi:NAD(P)/FAD-dependent oxidoreductase [Enterovirga aerilata]|uniref:FAD-binding oxidoreductase n=1 Tax=Enterovirga aerilata TaxID=2730920 RepID=A0A849IEA4_9HYPH|nr:FAD-dependent oxidoreductase [Enterovirga sp. DB1703]NNM74555.1 FAD-binding oxidoreductase [Enterovirga sp. DB1703]